MLAVLSANAAVMSGVLALIIVEAVMSQLFSRFAEAFESQHTAGNEATQSQSASDKVERRQAERIEHCEPAVMTLDGTVARLSLLNVSKRGIAVRVLSGRMPDIGDFVSIRLCDVRHLHGSPVWIDGDRFGLMFDLELEDVGEIVHVENRGAPFYQSAWRARNQLTSSDADLGYRKANGIAWRTVA